MIFARNYKAKDLSQNNLLHVSIKANITDDGISVFNRLSMKCVIQLFASFFSDTM